MLSLGVSSYLPVFCIRKIVCAWTADWHSATVSTQHCSCRPPLRRPIVRVAQCGGKEKTPRGLRAWEPSLLCLVIAVSLSKNVIRDQRQRPGLTQPSCEPQPFRCPVKRIAKRRAKRKPLKAAELGGADDFGSARDVSETRFKRDRKPCF